MTQTVLIQSVECLTPAEFRELGGRRRGTACWWLREVGGGFVRSLPSVPGTELLDETLELTPGSYVVGVGRGASAIRKRFRVHRRDDDRPVFVLVTGRSRLERTAALAEKPG